MKKHPWMAAAVVAAIHAATIGALLLAFPPVGFAIEGAPFPVMRASTAGDSGHGGHGAANRCESVAGATRTERCVESLLPRRYPTMLMGRPDYGTPAPGAGTARPVGRPTSLTDLHGPMGPADAEYTLTAAMGTEVIGGVRVMTFNGVTPGPTLTVREGDLLVVHLRNANVVGGVTIHWHGVDVPGAEDGVAGVTQNAVLPGQEYTYRFVVPDAGTYWYHTHQDSVRAVARGLVGAFVALPSDAVPDTTAVAPVHELVSVVHTYGTLTTINGKAEDTTVDMPQGTRVRARIVNTDNGPVVVGSSGAFTVAAIDGTDIDGAEAVAGSYVVVPAGGRVDLLVDVPPGGIRLGLVAGPSLVLGPSGTATVPAVVATHRFDPLSYGVAGGSALARAALGPIDRTLDYRVGTRRGFLDGRRGDWYTINGRSIPDVPMFVVGLGEVVRMRISNATQLAHPIHLHGHHVLVVSRDGVPASGAAWWVDSLEVDPGERYVVEFVADNPGVWMFHCHNLPHARAGLMTHVMYAGVTTPYRIGRISPRLVNRPE